MRRALLLCAAGACAASVALAAEAGAKPPRAQCSASIGIMGGFTGERAAIGQEVLHWARFAVARFNARNHTRFRLVEGDIEVDPAKAATVAQQFASNKKIVAVIGPDASSAVVVAGPIFTRARLAFVSASATRVSLTNGQFPTFSRVVPNDDVQAPTDAAFMANQLHAKTVVLIDNQTDYSLGLNAGLDSALRARGVNVTHESTTVDQIDFSSVIAKLPANTDVVFLPLQVPANAQLFAQQLAQQGKHAIVFGGDSVFSPADFHPEGAYVSSFAPDIHQIKADAALVKAYKAKYGDFASPFGPPVYAAADIIMRATVRVCANGKPTRPAVAAAVRKIRLANSILGGSFSFTRTGEPARARFYVFHVVGGRYRLVR
jgi:branched-chain amino acid transport system substrate-binding protein